jgi:hypothetical protein
MSNATLHDSHPTVFATAGWRVAGDPTPRGLLRIARISVPDGFDRGISR